MGKLGEKFHSIDTGSMDGEKHIAPAIAPALIRPKEWLSMSDLAALANIKKSAVGEAVQKRRWRGADLAVRMVAAGRGGAGGLVPQVHADTLPADLREAWYLQHGIELHEKVDAITGKTVMVPDQKYQPDAKYQKALSIARWRLDVIQPALNHASGSPERAVAVREIAGVVRLLPSGKRKKLTTATIYNWVKAYEAEKLSGLIRKTRADTGAKRKTVSRAWDAFFERHIDEVTHERVSDDLTAHIQSLWASGERGWRTITEKSTTKLIEISRDLKVIDFEALPLGRSGDKASTKTQFGVCCVSRRLVERDRDLKLIAIQDKDNAVFQDYYVPSIRRNGFVA